MKAHEKEKAKKAAGIYAANLIENGMNIGIGSGSTVFFFIEALGKKCREGLKVKALATSIESEKLAKKAQIPLLNSNDVKTLDLDIDGADEIDSQKNLLKGGGGALLREKIVAKMSKEMIVIIDADKEVEALGSFPLPLEIAPFGYLATKQHLNNLGFSGEFRKKDSKDLFITDNGNFIFDISFKTPLKNLYELNETLHNIPGVLETGLFLGIAGKVIVGYENGSVTVK